MRFMGTIPLVVVIMAMLLVQTHRSATAESQAKTVENLERMTMDLRERLKNLGKDEDFSATETRLARTEFAHHHV